MSKHYKVLICVEEIDDEKNTYTNVDLQFSDCADFDTPDAAITYAEHLFKMSQIPVPISDMRFNWTAMEGLMKQAEEDPMGSSLQHWYELNTAGQYELLHGILEGKTGVGAEWCGLCAYAESDETCNRLCPLARAGFNCHDGRSVYVEASDAFRYWFKLAKAQYETILKCGRQVSKPTNYRVSRCEDTRFVNSAWLKWRVACNHMYSTLINVHCLGDELPKK